MLLQCSVAEVIGYHDDLEFGVHVRKGAGEDRVVDHLALLGIESDEILAKSGYDQV